MDNVKVYQLNEYDGVAAESLEQAKDWYMEVTGLNVEDAFDDYETEEIPLSYKVWEDESRTNKQTLESIIAEQWEGKPFIAFCQEW